MLTSSARAPLLKSRNEYIARIPAVRPNAGRLIGGETPDNSLLVRYLEGWAEVNPAKILAATVPGYRFCDPLVGTFFRRTVREYFDLLQDRLSSGGEVRQAEVAIFLHGPIDTLSRGDELQFWREAPRVGLTGISKIKIGSRGVIADSVAYDLNLASDILRRRAFE
jgi:hypothetical protein